MSDSESKSYNALDFLMKFSLHVRYCFEKKNASDSEFEISEMSDLKKVCIQ